MDQGVFRKTLVTSVAVAGNPGKQITMVKRCIEFDLVLIGSALYINFAKCFIPFRFCFIHYKFEIPAGDLFFQITPCCIYACE